MGFVVCFAGTEQVVVDPFDPHPRSRPQVVNNSNHSSPTTSSLNNIDCDDDLDAFEVNDITYGFVSEGPECHRQYCDVTSDIALIKSLRFLINQESHSKNGLQPKLVRYDARFDTDAQNQSLTLIVNGP